MSSKEKSNVDKFFYYANEDSVLYTLTDKITGAEIDRFVIGKRYQWWILLCFAAIYFAVEHFA